MKKMKIQNVLLFAGISILLVTVLSGCGGSSSSSPAGASSNTYSTTSNRGDYSEWTLVGDQLDAIWEVINTSGGIDFTYTIAATCAVPDVNNVRSCAIDMGSCADGLIACTSTPSGSFDMMEVPGVAMFAHSTAATGGEDLHIGFAKNSSACAEDVSGDYTYIRAGLGLDENFGMYRSDANFLSVLHSDFGFDTADSNATQSVAYRTSTESETLGDSGCVNGVRERTINGGAETVRAMMTASGVFVLDLPAGQGGMLSFNVSNAASLADFANKNFAGISFPDNGPAEPLNATFSAVSGSAVNLTAVVNGGMSQNLNIMGLGAVDALTTTVPDYADFTVAPGAYSASTLAATYTAPENFPGLFKVGGLSDSGRVVMAAMNFNGKVIGVGMVYNYRTTTDINPSTGVNFVADGLYNTGNFVLFEK